MLLQRRFLKPTHWIKGDHIITYVPAILMRNLSITENQLLCSHYANGDQYLGRSGITFWQAIQRFRTKDFNQLSLHGLLKALIESFPRSQAVSEIILSRIVRVTTQLSTVPQFTLQLPTSTSTPQTLRHHCETMYGDDKASKLLQSYGQERHAYHDIAPDSEHVRLPHVLSDHGRQLQNEKRRNSSWSKLS